MMNKLFQHIGLFSFGIFFIFSCLYYQERTLFLDNAFQVFLMIVEGDIAINAHRWPAVFVRFLPYSLIQLGAPLKLVLLSFSFSYWLYHFLIFYILRYRLKERSFALLQLATVTLPVVHSFFWCNSEQNLAISLLVLTLALYKQKKYSWTAALCFILLWLHPLTFLPFGFIMSLHVADVIVKSGGISLVVFKRIKLPFIFGLFFTLMYVLKSTFIKNWYDNIKATNFKNNLISYEYDFVEIFQSFAFENSIVFPVISIGALVYLIYKRAFLKAFLWTLFALLYLTILDISREASYEFYDEVNYLILFFGAGYILLPFFEIRHKQFLKYFYVISLIWVIINWVSTSSFYTERIAWYKSSVVFNDRAIIEFTDTDKDVLIMPWASPYESIIISGLLSTKTSRRSSTMIFTNDVDKYNLELSEGLFYGDFKNYDLEDVNGEYFDLEPKLYYLK